MTCQEFRQQFMINMETIQEVIKMYWVPKDKKKISMDNKENEPQELTRERLRNGQNKLHIGKRNIITSIHLRNILEQSIECQVPLYVSFIGFIKAFDSINREDCKLWDKLKHYQIPDIYVNIIRKMYNGNTSCVIEKW